jgi:hypothetical protein
VIVFSEDEAHTLWGDTLGHVWCRENERTEVPIENVKERQTYYGVMNLYNQEFKISLMTKAMGKIRSTFLNICKQKTKEEG